MSQTADTVRIKPDWNPSRLHVGIDVSRLMGTAIKPHKSSLGGMIDLDFHRFLLAFEGGVEQINRIKTYEYTNQGAFLKWGIDYNLIPSNEYRNMISLGLRYAQSRFSDQLDFAEENPWFGTQTLQFSNQGCFSPLDRNTVAAQCTGLEKCFARRRPAHRTHEKRFCSGSIHPF